MADKIKGLMLKIGGDTSDLAKSLKDISSKSRELQTDLKTVDKLLKLDPTNTILVKQKQDLLSKSIETAKEKLEALEKCEKDVQKAFDNGTIDQTEFIEFQKNLVNAKKNLEKLQIQEKETETKTDELGSEVKDTSSEIKEMGEKSQTAADVMKGSLAADAIITGIKAIGNELKVVTQNVVDTGSAFEASMSQVAATMGMTSDDVQNGASDYIKLEKAAKEMGATTKYTAAEAADSLNYLALAGYDADKAVETLPKILTLAQAGGMDIAATSDLVTDAMGQLQMQTSELDGFVDQLAKTSQKSNTNVSQLGEALLVVGGTSVTAGQDVEKTNAALGILANNGIKGAEGGTKLRNILLSLTSPSKAAADKMEELGLKVADSEGNIRDIDDIMGDLNKTLSNMTEEEKTKVLSTIFNKRDLSGVTALLDSTNGAFSELYSNIVDSNGAAENMADTMNDNLQGKMYQVKSALEAVGIAAYSKFQAPLKEATEKSAKKISDFADEIENGRLSEPFEDLADSFADAAEKGLDLVEDVLPTIINGATFIMDNGGTIVGVLTGIGTAMLTQKAITTVEGIVTAYKDFKAAAESARTAQLLLNGATSASPFGLIALGVGIAAGALTTYKLNSEKATDATSYLSDKQKEVVDLCDDLNEKISKNQKTRQDSIKDTEAQWNGYKTMAEKLYTLNEQETISVGNKAQMKGMVDELNKAMPTLNLQLDEETGHLKNQKDVVMDLIDSNIELAKVTGAQDSLAEISKDLASAEIAAGKAEDAYKNSKKELDELTSSMEKNRAKVKEIEDAVGQGTIDMGIARNKYDELDKEYGEMVHKQLELKKSTSALKSTYDDTNLTLKDCQKEWDSTSQYISDHAEVAEGASENVENATEKMTISVGKYKDKTVEVVSSASEEIQSLEEEYETAYDKRTKELQDSLDIFKKFSTDSKVTAKTLMDNMKSNLEGMTNWSDGLAELTKRGVDEGLIQKLREAGPSSASEVAAMRTMTDEQLAKYNEDWRKYTQETNQIASEELSSLKDEINQKTDEAIQQAKNKKGSAKEAAKTAMSGAKEGVDEGLDDISNAFANHWLTSGKHTEEWEQKMAELHQKLYDGFYQAGQHIPEGFRAGILSKQNESDGAIASISDSMLYTGNTKLGIHSPSRKFMEIGDFIMQGEILGLKNRTPDLLDQMSVTQQALIDRAGQFADLQQTVTATNIAARQIYEQDSTASIVSHSSNAARISNNRSTDSTSSQPVINVNFGDVTINNDNDIEEIADKLMLVMAQKMDRRVKAYGY